MLASDVIAALDGADYVNAPRGLARPEGESPVLDDGVLTIQAGLLTQALTIVAAVVERRNTIPIIGCVRIEVGAGIAAFTGTDLDIEITADFIVPQCSGPSLKLCVAPHALLALARSLPADALVTIKSNRSEEGGQHVAVIAWSGGEATLPALPAADFPAFTCDDKHIVSWRESAGLIRTLDRLSPCISTEETRYYLQGICFNAEFGEPCATATDGHRLGSLPVNAPPEFVAHRPILPRKSVELVRRLFRDGPPLVSLHGETPNRMCFITQGLTLRTKLIDGAFPEWGVVAKKAEEGTLLLRVDRAAISAALAAVAPFSSERSRSVRLTVEGEQLTLAVENVDTGLVRAAGGAVSGTLIGEPLGLNGNYLATVLRQLNGDQFTLRSQDCGAPVCFESDERAPGERFILMPLRV